MTVTLKPAHEQFAQRVAAGEKAGPAYVAVFGQAKGADQSASRLLRNAKVALRIKQLSAQISSELRGNGLRDRDFRLKQLQNRYDALMQIVCERGLEYRGLADLAGLVDTVTGVVTDPAQFEAWRRQYPLLGLGLENKASQIRRLLEAAAPGGTTGYMLRDYRGKSADRVVFKSDTALLAELRAIEEQAAREMGDRSGEFGDKPGFGSPLSINIAFVSPSAA